MLNAKNAENTQSRHLTCFTFFSMNSIVTLSESVYQVETHFHKREIPGFHDFPPYLDVGMNDVVVTLIYLILKKNTGRRKSGGWGRSATLGSHGRSQSSPLMWEEWEVNLYLICSLYWKFCSYWFPVKDSKHFMWGGKLALSSIIPLKWILA